MINELYSVDTYSRRESQLKIIFQTHQKIQNHMTRKLISTEIYSKKHFILT